MPNRGLGKAGNLLHPGLGRHDRRKGEHLEARPSRTFRLIRATWPHRGGQGAPRLHVTNHKRKKETPRALGRIPGKLYDLFRSAGRWQTGEADRPETTSAGA